MGIESDEKAGQGAQDRKGEEREHLSSTLQLPQHRAFETRVETHSGLLPPVWWQSGNISRTRPSLLRILIRIVFQLVLGTVSPSTEPTCV